MVGVGCSLVVFLLCLIRGLLIMWFWVWCCCRVLLLWSLRSMWERGELGVLWWGS